MLPVAAGLGERGAAEAGEAVLAGSTPTPSARRIAPSSPRRGARAGRCRAARRGGAGGGPCGPPRPAPRTPIGGGPTSSMSAARASASGRAAGRPRGAGCGGPGAWGLRVVGPAEGLGGRGRDHGGRAAGGVGEGAPHDVRAMAALRPAWAPETTRSAPRRARGRGSSGARRERRPGLRGADGRAVRPRARARGAATARPRAGHRSACGRRGRRGQRGDAPALAGLEARRVEPQAGPLALRGARRERARALAGLAAGLGGRRPRGAAHAHGPHEPARPAGGHAGDPLGGPRGLGPRSASAWTTAARAVFAGLRGSRLPGKPEPVLGRGTSRRREPGAALGRALAAARADRALDAGLHEDLQHGPGEAARQARAAAPGAPLGQGEGPSSAAGLVLGALGEAGDPTSPDGPGGPRRRGRPGRERPHPRHHPQRRRKPHPEPGRCRHANRLLGARGEEGRTRGRPKPRHSSMEGGAGPLAGGTGCRSARGGRPR